MSWEKLPAWTGVKNRGCLHAPAVEEVAPMDMIVAVGFGYAGVTKDGEEVWSESPTDEFQDCYGLGHFESLAVVDPDHDWRVVIHGPLSGHTYQRHGVGKWVLVDSNEGFA